MATRLEELRKQAEELFKKEQFREIIALLLDDVLEQYKDAPLYTWRARAHGRLGENNICLGFAEKAIAADSNYFMSFLARGNVWYVNGEYDKAITDYNKTIELNADYAVAYNNRGNSWSAKGGYDKAIADYDKAIELNPNYADAYNNRGSIWDEKGGYDKAIADYDKAIELNPNYAGAYNNRGISWKNKGDYDKAIADYDKAIELNPGYAVAYNNRGHSWYAKDDYEKAIADYEKAIGLKKDYALAYRNRGLLFEKKNEPENAKADYENAVKYNPADTYAKSLLDKLLARLGQPITETTEENTDDPFYKIREVLKELTVKQRTDILQFYQNEIDPKIKDIRKLAVNTEQVWVEALKDKYREEDTKLVAHYSSLKTADILIMRNRSSKARMRYSNAVFMNDPEEGRILIEYLDKLEKDQKDDREIKAAFENALKEEKTNFYLGSFLPMIKNHEDELLMWRTYGKDENLNEAAGCCILLNIDFFDEHDGGHMALGRDDDGSKITHPLYKVLYYDQRDGEFVGTDKESITKLIIELKDALKILLAKKSKKKEEEQEEEEEEEEKKLNKVIDRVLYHSLSELRYFFKSADYSYESELRVIRFATRANVVKIDEAGGMPRKMYIESTKDMKPYLKKIVLGPKVQHPERWMYLAEQMRRDGHEMDIVYSTCHFR